MAPYLRHIESSNSSLISTLSAKNDAELESMDKKLKDAEENLGDSEISELLRSKAMYLCRIGDKVGLAQGVKVSVANAHSQERAIPALDKALEKTAGLGARIDLVLAMVRMGLFYSDSALVTANITRATE